MMVRGTVNARAYHFPAYTILTIDDGADGASLEVRNADTKLDAFQPGDQVSATGKVSQVAGMNTLETEHISLLGHIASSGRDCGFAERPAGLPLS